MNKRRRLNPERRPMTDCERGVWIDTEGHIESLPPPKGKYVIHITSMEREPLEDYCAGAQQDTVKCVVKTECRPPTAPELSSTKPKM